ncbi:lantibiotic dehydratase [Pseudonocardia sp. ICBG1142]|uniref:lantibiotic dehydratase n=1 Tax=Pseudonocardia sp. ICBG1142 TaxID=2846760 RepID=UPI0035A8EEFE
MVMLRCPTRSVDCYPSPTVNVEPLEDIRRMWADSLLRESVRAASPVLYQGIMRLLDSPREVKEKRVQSLHRTLVRYSIRIATRTTPFGTFSGFAMVRVGDDDPIRLGTAHRRYARVGSSFARRLTHEASLIRSGVSVQVNPSALIRSDRLVALVRPHGPDGSVNERSSVRVTPPVRAVLRIARDPVGIDDLLRALVAEFPTTDDAVLITFLHELQAAGLLVSELDSSLFDRDPLSRLRSDPVIAPRVEAVSKALDQYAEAEFGRGENEIGHLYQLLRVDPNSMQEELQVDLQLEVHGCIPAKVIRWAEDALAALICTTPVPAWQPEIQAHAERFAEHFGETLVPLHEVLDPEYGIGFPAGYPTSRHQVAATRMSTPERVLRAGQRLRSRLVEKSRQDSTTRVVLSEELLATMPPVLGRRAASYDVFLHLQRPSVDNSIQATLGPVGVGMPGGRAHGRFAHHDSHCHDHMINVSAHDREHLADTQFFEVDYISNRPAVNNVSLAPSIESLRLALTTGEFDREVELLRVQEILLGVGPDGFRLVHSATGKRLLFRAGNLAAPDISTDLVRFLEEISADGFVRPAWHWGDSLDVLDFLPGVTFRDTELVAPQWRLPELKGGAEKQDQELLRWISAAGVPDYVHVGTLDNRLLLDLRNRLHRDLLRRELASGAEWASEAIEPARLGWVEDTKGKRYAGEIVVSVATTGHAEQVAQIPQPRWTAIDRCHRILPPGREWWYARLSCPPGLQNSVLSQLAAGLSGNSWFYVRYTDTVDHLRVRLQVERHNELAVTSTLNELLDQNSVSCYSIDTYRREVERYGGLEGMRAAEALFCAESDFLASRPELLLNPERRYANPLDGEVAPGRDTVELMSTYLHAICDSSEDMRAVVHFACSGYRAEFKDSGQKLRQATRSPVKSDVSGSGYRSAQALSRQLFEPSHEMRRTLGDLPDLTYRTQIKQALTHMFANRMGLSRQQEYQAVFTLDSLLRADVYRERMNV